MKFVKMEAQGNDFIIAEHISKISYNEIAKKLCNRHFGIGADGLVTLSRSENCDIRIKIYNADGSLAQICGSALRCVAKYISNGKKHLKIKTDAGIKNAFLLSDSIVKVNIGKPEFLKTHSITISGLKGYFVSTGNPHFVIFVTNLENVENYVDIIKNNKIFSEGINLEFVKIISDREVQVRVFERGVGETLACGTGASAIQFVGYKNGILNKKITLHFKGGDVFTEVENENIYLWGEVKLVFRGEISL